MNANSIPKEKVKQILTERGASDIASVSAALIQSGYKHPDDPQTKDTAAGKGERINPFIRDLETCLTEMCSAGTLKVNTEDATKKRYEVNPVKA